MFTWAEQCHLLFAQQFQLCDLFPVTCFIKYQLVKNHVHYTTQHQNGPLQHKSYFNTLNTLDHGYECVFQSYSYIVWSSGNHVSAHYVLSFDIMISITEKFILNFWLMLFWGPLQSKLSVYSSCDASCRCSQPRTEELYQKDKRWWKNGTR